MVEVQLGDLVRMRKPHPCGGYDWQVVRLGADIGIRCLRCQRRVMHQQSMQPRRASARELPSSP